MQKSYKAYIHYFKLCPTKKTLIISAHNNQMLIYNYHIY